MIPFRRRIPWLLGMLCLWAVSSQAIVINEFMADNVGAVHDPQGDADDWIELYNPASQAVDVGGWYLTDDLGSPLTWRIPDGTQVPALGFLVVWADKDTTDPGLHANFSLRAGGEEIGLFRGDGSTLVDSVIFDQQVADRSYARYPDGAQTWRFAEQPSPGLPNATGVLGIVAPVEFSAARGFYDGPLTLTLSTETDGAEIWITTDANRPGPGQGQAYTGPLTIDRSTCVRAIATKADWQDSEVTTQTYLFAADILHQPSRPAGFPAQWGSNRVDYAMDPRVVDDPANADLVTDLRALPSVSLVLPNADLFDAATGLYANARQRHDPDQGQDWERAVSLEWIDPATGRNFGTGAGLRIFGGSDSRSPSTAKHGFRLLFKSEYGPGTLKAPLFPGQDVERFDSLILRALWDDAWIGNGIRDRAAATYLRDAYCQQTFADLGHLTTGMRPVHLYLNGLYWGIYTLIERPDERFLAEHLGGDPDRYDMLRPGDSKTGPLEVVSGTRVAWDALSAAAEGAATDPNLLTGLTERLDADNLIDYILLVAFTGSRDAPTYLDDTRQPHNFYTFADRVGGGPFRFLPWSMQFVLEDPLENRVTAFGGRENPGRLFEVLGQDPEFRLRVADRIQARLAADGLLSPGPAGQRLMDRVREIEDALVAESARWGDAQGGAPLTRDGAWTTEIDRIANTYLEARSAAVIEQFRAAGWIPSVPAPAFTVDGTAQHGGRIDLGATIGLHAATGTIYYSFDGLDPRLPGGTIRPEAQAFTQDLALTRSTPVLARTLADGVWSALSRAVFVVGPLAESLRITEIMMNPVDPNAEFLELANLGTETLNLNLAHFSRGIDLAFGDLALAPGEHAVVVRNRSVFTATYGNGPRILGQYDGSLANNGERLTLLDGTDAPLLDLTYGDRWYDLADGEGFSLVLRSATGPAADLSAASAWRPSNLSGGSPGQADPERLPEPGTVVINEVLANTATAAPDWIELHNTSDQAVALGGWGLSDDPDERFKYRIPSAVVLPPQGYVVFYQDSHFPFGLSAGGETVVLQAALDGQAAGYLATEPFGASAPDVSLGRIVKSTGTDNFVALAARTPGAANSDPLVGPVVISEIMYHPLGDAGAEYLELLNVSDAPVDLANAAGTRTWRLQGSGDPGIDLRFADHGALRLAPGGRVLLVRNKAAFLAVYSPPVEVPVLAWGPGALGNGGDRIQLDRPGEADTDGDFDWLRVDRVNYSDGAHPLGSDPWPAAADGLGSVLQRSPPDAYGNDPANWSAAAPTPGR